TNVTVDHTIDVSFAVAAYTITASAGAGGAISPSGAVPVNSGADQSFTMTPEAGYQIADIVVDGASVGAVASHTFTNVTADHTIAPSFAALKVGDVITNSIGMKLVYIPAGSFTMGSSHSAAQLAGEYDELEWLFTDEFPQHQVRISKGFWMGQTEVTQGQYKSVMNAQPWSGKDFVQESANNPAVYVSWGDAVAFCRELSKQEGKTYRLPTEAEWEYACRAGTKTRFSFGESDLLLGEHAWFQDNTKKVGNSHAHSVGQKKPNPWDLYDMHGNVCEWCSDWYAKDYYSNSQSVDPNGPSSGASRSLRGGSWYGAGDYLRCSMRCLADPVVRGSLVGFRVVRSQ
ncbi:MAG: SUMF1/EgtB/PvdO family nonheme iron enzyme, partial [Planctomycetota bacterium]